jgi:hypothetical protein
MPVLRKKNILNFKGFVTDYIFFSEISRDLFQDQF